MVGGLLSGQMNSGVRCLSLMGELYTGKQNDYFWLARPVDARGSSRPLAHLLQTCPEVVLDKVVVVTSLDGGPLPLTSQQASEGWERHGEIAISPRISNTGVLPFKWFDEWYVFHEPTVPADVEVFVNYGTFSLGDPRPAISTMYAGSDEEIVERIVEGVVKLREKFWAQMERIKPKSYMANGNSFIFVTHDSDLFEKAAGALESL